MVMGLMITGFFAHAGIDYTGIEFAGISFRHLLYPVLAIHQFIKYPLWVFIFTVLVGIYPAIFAARMNPVEAMRKSM